MEFRAEGIFLFYYAGMKRLHTKDTKYARRSWYSLRLLRGVFLLLAGIAGAQEATQKPRIICEHAAPPPGMRWVCKSPGFCDCHLEGQLKDDKDGVISPQHAERPEGLTHACQPLMTKVFAPVYPPIARTNRITGKVFVQVELSPEGNVSDASIVEGHPLFKTAVLKAAKQWRFNPACSQVQMITVTFSLDGDDEHNPPGFVFQPPDELEIVGEAMVINTTTSKVKRKKRAEKVPKKSGSLSK